MATYLLRQPRYRHYRKRYYRKRKLAKRKARKNINKAVQLSPGRRLGMPKMAYITLPYATEKVITTANPYNQYQFSLLGLYDFDQSGGGHQPPYFDVLSLIWQRYRVYKAEVTVRIANTSAVNARAGIAVCKGTGETPFDESAEDLVNNKDVQVRLLAPSGQDKALGVFKRTINYPKDYFPRTSFWGDLQFGSAFTSNPASSLYLYVGSASIDGTTNATFTFTLQTRLYVRLENKDTEYGRLEA